MKKDILLFSLTHYVIQIMCLNYWVIVKVIMLIIKYSKSKSKSVKSYPVKSEYIFL
jgi:hypothetical protein